MYFPYYFDWTLIILIPAIVLSFWAQAKVSTTFSKYSQVRCSRGYTGADAARKMLNANGLDSVPIYAIQGTLTDHFDPRNNSISLSDPVVDEQSISAIAVACHECGHAIQDARGYAPLRWRSSLVPIANFGSRFSWILFIIGLFMASGLLIKIGVLLFALTLLFQLVTLPVEFNASSRALAKLENSGWMSTDELAGSKQVLGAAAMTYVASACTSLMYLLRMLSLSGRRR